MGRDNGHRLAESRARKLGVAGALAPDDERRLARAAALPVAELRARITADREALAAGRGLAALRAGV